MLSEGVRRAGAIGADYEAALPADVRRRGAHYTPVDVAVGLVARALHHVEGRPRSVLDPACGGGAFLVAVADALVARGTPAADALGVLHGVDADRGAVAAATAALESWAADHDVARAELDGLPVRIVAGDGLTVAPPEGGWDLVVGNPPFQAQLRTRTTRGAGARAEAHHGFGAAGRGYVDTAALFMVRTVTTLARGGVAAMILPRSLLAARDATEARRTAVASARLAEMWLPGPRVFDAAVDVCAPLFVADGTGGGSVALTGGRVAEPAGITAAVGAGSWAPLLAAAEGVPALDLPLQGPTLETVATCIAGFRDEYYGLVDHVRAEPPPGRRARLVTSGAIDPARLTWAERPVRFARRAWRRPWVDLDALAAAAPATAAWVERTAGPKVVVATQTRVVEAYVDAVGDVVGATPVISVVPASDAVDPWDLAAVLCAPPVTALLHCRLAGSGLSPGALRLTAGHLGAVPLPPDATAWAHGATQIRALHDTGGDAAARAAAWAAFGVTMCRAYGVDPDPVVGWWRELLPRRAGPADQIDVMSGDVVS